MAVTSALQGMLRTFNQLLEHSLSVRSWRYRVEAWRTGKSYAEVVLLRTLVYRVEQVLLVDRNTGLLLMSVAAPDVTPQDPGLVSGMLTALQEFIHDSFDVEKSAGIQELRVGDFSLWVEQGPRAALAAAVRGCAPTELRETLRAALDLVHRECAAELRDFRGDTEPFEQRCVPILEGCLQSQYQTPEKTSYRKVWLCIAGLAAVLALWLAFRLLEERRWSRAVAALRETPGIVITQVQRRGGKYVVEGLRDPLSSSPEILLANYGVDARKVAVQFQPFFSLDPRLLAERVRQDNGLELLRADIEAQTILFSPNSSAIVLEQARLCRGLAAKSQQWVAKALAIGRIPRLEVSGYISETFERNRYLSRERAERVAGFLLAAGVPRVIMTVQGEGPAPIFDDGAQDDALRRKVTLKLFLSPAGNAGREEP